MQTSNVSIAKMLRSVAAALTIKKQNSFKIKAYESAADAIEHSTSQVQNLWEEGKLDDIPGVGESLQAHLNEFFKTGSVKHFESLKKGIEPAVFEMLDIPGVGPKTALELAELGVRSVADLKKKLENGELVKKGFSEKVAPKILSGIEEVSGREDRMLMPVALFQARKIIDYLMKGPGVTRADPLGSLRRRVATIGDLDFSAASNKPKEVVDYFVKMPGVSRIVNQGDDRATVMLGSGLHVDILVGKPESYGALLQHFTGSKHHNIKLRTYFEKKGLSLNEIGIEHVKSGKITKTKTEEEFYKELGMQTPAPEMREDAGEIEAALKHELPALVELKDIKGDIHLHSNSPLEPSHGPGVDSIQAIIKRAEELGYEYVGISDHPPGFTTHSKEQITKLIEKRTKVIQEIKKNMSKLYPTGIKSVRVLNGLEIDILGNGDLSVPDEVLEQMDYVIAGIHSGHRGESGDLTKRILSAVESPHVDIMSHPTGRLINERNSFEADWEEIFKAAAKHKTIMEINASPSRLDLRDDLVRLALSFGVKFVINTDAHKIAAMDDMEFGVYVGRRGWVEAKDVVNAWDWKKFAEWFKIKT